MSSEYSTSFLTSINEETASRTQYPVTLHLTVSRKQQAVSCKQQVARTKQQEVTSYQ